MYELTYFHLIQCIMPSNIINHLLICACRNLQNLLYLEWFYHLSKKGQRTAKTCAHPVWLTDDDAFLSSLCGQQKQDHLCPPVITSCLRPGSCHQIPPNFPPLILTVPLSSQPCPSPTLKSRESHHPADSPQIDAALMPWRRAGFSWRRRSVSVSAHVHVCVSRV